MAGPVAAAVPGDGAADAPAEPAGTEDAAEEPAEPAAVEPATAGAEEGAEDEEDALSGRPAPQAATETASVTAPAAAMNRRNVVLRMEPLSAGRSTGWGATSGGRRARGGGGRGAPRPGI